MDVKAQMQGFVKQVVSQLLKNIAQLKQMVEEREQAVEAQKQEIVNLQE